MELPQIKKQYFIAIVPEPPLRDSIDALKSEIKKRFGAAHALKSPAHITLQMPFHKFESEEPALLTCLREFAATENGFYIHLNGFDCFPPKVLFVRVMEHQPLQELQSRLKERLTSQLGFSRPSTANRFHPHMTIATRDLQESDFPAAWADFKSRSMRASFFAGSLHLLKHNGKFWDLCREFPFQDAIGA